MVIYYVIWSFSQGVTHRDLKLENVLLRKDGSAALVDFGLAINEMTPPTSVSVGTLDYFAPEVQAFEWFTFPPNWMPTINMSCGLVLKNIASHEIITCVVPSMATSFIEFPSSRRRLSSLGRWESNALLRNLLLHAQILFQDYALPRACDLGCGVFWHCLVIKIPPTNLSHPQH